MDPSAFRSAAHAAVDEIIDYFDTIQDRPVASKVEPGYLRKMLPDGPPDVGEDWNLIQKDIEAKIMPGLMHWQSPDFMAFFPTASTYPAILGELYSAALSAPGFNWQCSPAMTELEVIVMDWMAKLLHLPESFQSHTRGGGVIQGSASEATTTVMVAARENYVNRACEGLNGPERDAKSTDIRGRLVALGSDQSHSSVAKAAIIAGVRHKAIPTTSKNDYSVTGSDFQKALEECKSEGLEPFHLTTTIGTTPTCAVDDIQAITTINESAKTFPPLWIHVDAAWAGAALILEEYAHLTMPFEHVQSFSMNMHKWLLVNFDCSPLFLRDRRNLTDVLSLTPSYVRNQYSDSGLVTDYRDWQIPFGRRFRSLKVWFVLRTYGVNGMKDYLQRHLDLGSKFAGWIESRPDLFKIVTPPAFALTVFTIVPRHVPTQAEFTELQINIEIGAADASKLNESGKEANGEDLEKANGLTREVYEKINASGKVFLSSTMIHDVFAIRVVSANTNANEDSLRSTFKLIVSITEDVLKPSES